MLPSKNNPFVDVDRKRRPRLRWSLHFDWSLCGVRSLGPWPGGQTPSTDIRAHVHTHTHTHTCRHAHGLPSIVPTEFREMRPITCLFRRQCYIMSSWHRWRQLQPSASLTRPFHVPGRCQHALAAACAAIAPTPETFISEKGSWWCRRNWQAVKRFVPNSTARLAQSTVDEVAEGTSTEGDVVLVGRQDDIILSPWSFQLAVTAFWDEDNDAGRAVGQRCDVLASAS